MQLEGKNVIYVGGFGGIGEKCVESFLKKSVKSLIIFDLNSNAEYLKFLKNTYNHSYVDYVHLDLTKPENIRKVYKEANEKMGTFDIVINGSGIIDEGKIDQVVQINLTGLIHSCLTALEYMSKAKGGRGGAIINISSTAGLNPTEMFCVYSATKCGVTTFTRSLAKSLYFDKTGVSFINICPGGTLTPLLVNAASRSIAAQYYTEIPKTMNNIKLQSPEIFAENLVRVVEKATNGSTWVLSDETIQEVHFPVVWGPM